MGIVHALVGCCVAALIYLVLALVTPIEHLGIWSTVILVALCLVCTSWVGYWPFWGPRTP
jgi:hypothetical protein